MGSRGKRIFQLLISFTLLGVLIYWIDLGQMWRIVQTADVFLLILALMVATCNRILMAIKWNILLRVKGIHLSWFEVTRIYYTSTFLGVFLPPTIGVDTVKAYRVSREGADLTDVISSIVMERVLGMLALLAFGIMGGIIFLTTYANIEFNIMNVLQMLVVVTIGGVLVFIVSLSKSFGAVVLKLFELVPRNGKYLRKVTETLETLYRSYQSYNENKAALGVFFMLTCLENVLPVVRPYIIAMALGAYVPLSFLFVIVPIELVLIRLPISFDGFGIREGLFVYFLPMIGITANAAFTIGLANHLLFLVAVLPGWLFYVRDGKDREAKGQLARTRA